MADNSLLGSFESLWHYGLPSSNCRPLHSSSSTPSTRSASRPVATESAFVSIGSLQSLSSVMDEDGDGRLRLCDMRSLLTKLHISSQSTHLQQKSLIEQHTHIDVDGFSLDFPQFSQLYAALFGASHSDSSGTVQNQNDDDDDELLDAFRVYDTNHDGFISAAELAAVLLELGLLPADRSGVNAHLSRCQAYIERVDLDGDGMVDFVEFKAMMAHHHIRLPTSPFLL